MQRRRALSADEKRPIARCPVNRHIPKILIQKTSAKKLGYTRFNGTR